MSITAAEVPDLYGLPSSLERSATETARILAVLNSGRTGTTLPHRCPARSRRTSNRPTCD